MIGDLAPVVADSTRQLWWFDMWRRLGRQIHHVASTDERSEFAFVVPDRRCVALALAVGCLDGAVPEVDDDERRLESLVGCDVNSLIIKGNHLVEDAFQLSRRETSGWRLVNRSGIRTEPCSAAIRSMTTEGHTRQVMQKSDWNRILEWCGNERATALAWLRGGRPRVSVHGVKSNLLDEASQLRLGLGDSGVAVSDLALTAKWSLDDTSAWMQIDAADDPIDDRRQVLILDGARASRIHPHVNNSGCVRILAHGDADMISEANRIATSRMMRTASSWAPDAWDLPPGVEFIGWAA